MFQFAGVKTAEVGATVPSLVSSDDRAIVTSSSGSESRAIVKVAWSPASLVLPLIALTLIPAVSLFSVVTETTADSPLKALSELMSRTAAVTTVT